MEQQFQIIFQVTDRDFAKNGKISSSIEPDNYFKISQSGDTIVTKIKFDRELQDTYEIRISSCDNGEMEVKCSQKNLSVKIDDKNDFAPEMKLKKVEIELPENFPLRKKFLRVHAFDKDDPEKFGKINFMIASEMFGIDNTTGEVFLKKSLDYEKAKDHQVKIINFFNVNFHQKRGPQFGLRSFEFKDQTKTGIPPFDKF